NHTAIEVVDGEGEQNVGNGVS
ncbi:MAG: hypothetical protein RLZZ599_156, partial [Bacteroidota bacterium]